MSDHTKSESDLREDLRLVRDLKEGDIAAFEELVRRYARRVFQIAVHITKCQEDADEVAQDVFLKVFTNLHNFEERSEFATWLTRIAINTALMKVRGRSKYAIVSLSDEEQSDEKLVPKEVADWRPNPEQLYSRAELNQILIKALESLTDNQRTIFVLRDIEGFSIAETAELLNLSMMAVKARLTRARLQLRERLSVHFKGDGRHARLAARCGPSLAKVAFSFANNSSNQTLSYGCSTSADSLLHLDIKLGLRGNESHERDEDRTRAR